MAITMSAFSKPQPARRRLEVKGKDPSRHYRWIDTEELGRVEDILDLGYRIESSDKKSGSAKAGDDGIPGNARRVGQLVLTSCPREDFERRERQRREFTRRFTNRSIDHFKTQARSMGVEVEDRTVETTGPMSDVVTDNEEE